MSAVRRVRLLTDVDRVIIIGARPRRPGWPMHMPWRQLALLVVFIAVVVAIVQASGGTLEAI